MANPFFRIGEHEPIRAKKLNDLDSRLTTLEAGGGGGPTSLAYTSVTGVPTGTVLYRKSAGTGAAEAQTLATLKTDLGLSGTNTGDQDLSGYATTASVTSGLAGKEPSITAGTTAQYWRGDKSWQTLDKTAVGLANVENKSSATIRGELTSLNVTTALGFTPQVAGSYLTANQTITLSGDVSGSGATAITVTIGANKVTRGMLAATSGAALLGATAAGNVSDLTGTQATALLNTFTSAAKGLAPASGGGTTNFLRADGTWAAPPTGGLTDTDYGDVLVSGSGTAMTVQSSAGDFAAGGNVTLPAAKTVTIPTPSSAVNLRVGTLPAIPAWAGFFLNAAFTGSAWALDDTAKNGWFFKLDARDNTGDALNGLWVYRIPQGANPHSDEYGAFGVTNGFTYIRDGLSLGNTTVAAPTSGYKLDVTGAIKATALDTSGAITASNLSGTNTGDETNSTILSKLSAASGGGTTNFLRADGAWAAPPGGGGSGTVTSVSVTTANGVSGSVANASTTPAITLTLGAITPTSVAATGTVTGSNLSGTNTGDQTITLTGDVTGSGAGSFAATIANGAVTLAKMANVATGTVFYRKTAGSGAPEVQTLATLKSDLGLTGTNSGDQTITLTGDVSGSGTGSFATTLATVNANVGTFGSSTLIPVVTVNGKGLVTAISTVAVAGGGGSGTVTSVSVTTANGVSGTVATATTTPAITLTLGAITPSSVAASGALTSSSASAGIGYATGAGGAVTQTTSRTTGVTLNKISGQITLVAAIASAGNVATFTVTNSTVAATDVVVCSVKSSTGTYEASASAVAAGSFNMTVRVLVASGVSESPVINFVVIKAVAA